MFIQSPETTSFPISIIQGKAGKHHEPFSNALNLTILIVVFRYRNATLIINYLQEVQTMPRFSFLVLIIKSPFTLKTLLYPL